MKTKLLLFLLISLLCAEKFVVTQQEINHNRFFAITDLLEEIAVLETHIFDVSDVSISTMGSNSLMENSVLFCIDGLPLQTFHDGKQLLAQRLLQNYDIDSIIAYTGADVYRYSGSADAVVNIITKNKEAYDKHAYAKAYLGSEVGDPALLKKVLPADSIPPNKDQYIAGEAAGAYFNENLLIKGGFTIELMDPYSGFHEHKRSLFFPKQNAHQSLVEHKEGSIRMGIQGGNFYSMNTITAGDYRLFRYSPFAGRYYYFDGVNGSIRSHNSLKKDKLSLKMNLFAFADQGHIFQIDLDSTKANRYFGAGDISAKLAIKEDLTLTGHVALHGNNSSIDKTSAVPQIADTNLNVQAHLGVHLKKSRVQLTYPLGVQFFVDYNEKFKSNHSLVYPKGSSSAVYGSELTWTKESPSNELQVIGGFKVSPTMSYIKMSNMYFKEYHESKYHFVPQIVVQNKHLLFGKAYGKFSTYGGKVGISRDLPFFKTIYFKGGVDYTLPTFWNGLEPVAYMDKDEGQKVGGYVVGNLSLIYKLKNDRLRFSAAVRNIGKKHYELPQGGLVGPVVVTNLEVAF